jgi:ATP-dependent 26S proteasome regulatory subunit
MNYVETKELLKQYLLARIPFITFDTIEKGRALTMLKDLSSEMNMSIGVSSMSKGIIDIVNNTLINDNKTIMGVLDYIADDIKKRENCTYVLTDVVDIDKDTAVTRYLCDIVNVAEEHNATIIVITSNSVINSLQRLGMSVNLELPDEMELFEFIKEFVSGYSSQIQIEWDDEDFKEASTILLGLSEIEVKNIISSLIATGVIAKEDLVELKYAKDRMFSDISGLEKVDVDRDLSFGGLDNLKQWLEEKRKLMSPSKREEMKRRNIKPPRGILIMGVPGCGKSLAAKAISAKWQLPLYLLDFATVQGRYVGQSEQQLKEALEAAEYVSPCVLWIDEIEKGLSGVSSDNGITNRMIGQFLFWLQECKKEVFVVATANNIDNLPAELLRKGRFDELFFVDLPNEIERKEILTLYIAKYLRINVNDDFMNKLIELTNGFSGADLEATIRDISYKVVADNIQLTQELFINTLSNTISLSKTNPEKIEKIRTWGKEHAMPATKK